MVSTLLTLIAHLPDTASVEVTAKEYGLTHGDLSLSAGLFRGLGSFHPTELGQEVYSNALEQYIIGCQEDPSCPVTAKDLPKNPPPSSVVDSARIASASPELSNSYGSLTVIPSGSGPSCATKGGQTVQVFGDGLLPGVQVSISYTGPSLGATTEVIGTTTADVSGAIDASVVMPTDLPASSDLGTSGFGAGLDAIGAGSGNAQIDDVSVINVEASGADACAPSSLSFVQQPQPLPPVRRCTSQ